MSSSATNEAAQLSSASLILSSLVQLPAGRSSLAKVGSRHWASSSYDPEDVSEPELDALVPDVCEDGVNDDSDDWLPVVSLLYDVDDSEGDDSEGLLLLEGLLSEGLLSEGVLSMLDELEELLEELLDEDELDEDECVLEDEDDSSRQQYEKMYSPPMPG